MTAYPAWTPAARPGIIPLRPLSFGLILGRSFSALRQNPRVLLGFALAAQSIATFVGTAALVAVMVSAYLRLDTLRSGTPEFDQVMAGSVTIIVIASILISLALGAVGVLVQGVVVSEVTHAVLAEKLTLGVLWRRVKPVAWRLIGYTLLLTVVILVAVALVTVGVIALAVANLAGGIMLAVVLVLAAIPLSLWLTVKLLLVGPIIIVEQATITAAVARSWRLTTGRFWPTLGIFLIVSVVFSVLAYAVSIPFSFLTTALSTVLSPTGDPETGTIVLVIVGGTVTQIVTVLVQAVALIVQSTATSLIYVDSRMRREGLDQDLLAYVERRDAGVEDLADPYTLHIGRVLAPRAPVPAYPAYLGYAPPYPGGPGYGAYPGTAGYGPYPGNPPQPAPYGAAAAPAPASAPAPAPAAPPSPTPASAPVEQATPWAQP